MSKTTGNTDPVFSVIGCGLPRTGTTSLGVALGILLGGPVFDGGTVSFGGSKLEQNQLLELAKHALAGTPEDRAFVSIQLKKITSGCVASVDLPGCCMVQELAQLYPEAKVICTVRDKDSWWASYSTLWTCIHELYPLSWLSPQLRRFCRFSYEIWKCVPPAVGIPPGPAWPMDNHKGLYDAHAEYVRRVVAEDRLYYFDVKDGWEPLCRILDVPVPDIPFPHQLRRDVLTKAKGKLMMQLRLRLITVIVAGGLLAGVSFWISSPQNRSSILTALRLT